jgi:hypothetical protein
MFQSYDYLQAETYLLEITVLTTLWFMNAGSIAQYSHRVWVTHEASQLIKMGQMKHTVASTKVKIC